MGDTYATLYNHFYTNGIGMWEYINFDELAEEYEKLMDDPTVLVDRAGKRTLGITVIKKLFGNLINVEASEDEMDVDYHSHDDEEYVMKDTHTKAYNRALAKLVEIKQIEKDSTIN